MNTSKDEAGHTVLVSWQYPIAQHVQIGWITLIYELRYRAASEPNNWKVLRQTWHRMTEKTRWLCYVVGEFIGLVWFVCTRPLTRTNQYKVILADHLCLMMNLSCDVSILDESGLIQDDGVRK